MKKYQSFLSENFQCLVVNFSIYLNRRVFVKERSVRKLPGEGSVDWLRA